MNAGTQTIENMFTVPQRFVVPLFQRPYVWTRVEQLKPLWEDVCRVADVLLEGKAARPHFLGAIVLEQLPNPTGYLQTRLVIDGQQRLTTLQLLLEAFSDVCRQLGVQGFDQALLQLTRNSNPLSKEADERFKVWPTNVDRDHFRRVMEVDSPHALGGAAQTLKEGEAGHALVAAYRFFFEVVSEWLGTDGEVVEARVKALFDALYRHVQLVVIDLGKDDDPQMIFETLNARGTPLLPSDLVKNFLFRRAESEGDDPQELYRSYWEPFDTSGDYWRGQVGRGHAKRARIDLFLQNFLTLRIEDDVALGQLYAAYCEHVKATAASLRSEDHLALLHRYARIYHQLDLLPLDSAERRFVERVKAMETVSVYPFLLELIARHGGEADELRPILIDLESFLVRRMICQRNTRGYGRLFVDMLRSLNAPGGQPRQRIRHFLLESDAESRQWPTDQEFRQAWMTLPMYQQFVQRRICMLLWALEGELRGTMSEKITVEGTLTIEHVLPIFWDGHWPLPDGQDSAEAKSVRNRLLDTIGNLTLLTGKLNPAVSNAPWSEKRAKIQQHSVLMLNKELVERETWDEDAIRQRGERLLERALKIWPRPSS